MAPISVLIVLITVSQFTRTKACKSINYVRPYSSDIVKEFPPLRFPGPESTGDVSELTQKLLTVERQIKMMGLYKTSVDVAVINPIGNIPYAGGVLQSAVDALVDELMPGASLEDLSMDLKIKLGIQEALAKRSLSHFKADVRVLQRRLRELTGNVSIDTKRHSAIPAIQVCERILELFDDESYLFWELKLIFYPYLMSFTGLYATVAAAAAQLVPEHLASIQQHMELLRSTVLKYHPEVRMERLSKLTLNRYDPDKEPKRFRVHSTILHNRCPHFQGLEYEPSSNDNIFSSCIRGGGKPSHEIDSLMEQEYQGVKNLPNYFEDDVTGDIFCGWDACWHSLYKYIENGIDNLTMSALESIPFINVPIIQEIRRPNPNTYFDYLFGKHSRQWSLICDQDSAQRLRSLRATRNDAYRGFGCHKGYCWAYCESGNLWCYTKAPSSEEYAKCERQEDCCAYWQCNQMCHDP